MGPEPIHALRQVVPSDICGSAPSQTAEPTGMKVSLENNVSQNPSNTSLMQSLHPSPSPVSNGDVKNPVIPKRSHSPEKVTPRPRKLVKLSAKVDETPLLLIRIKEIEDLLHASPNGEISLSCLNKVSVSPIHFTMWALLI